MSPTSWLLAGSLCILMAGAQAHGDWPAKHGGIMNEGGETSFELVAKGRKAVFHVEDHGSPIDMKGAHGTLTVTRGSQSWTSTINPAGANRMESQIPRSLRRGDRALARVTLANGSIVAGRFGIK